MEECFVGTVLLFAGKYAPKGFVECNGMSLPTRENQVLYAVIGNTYGGDTNTFKVPKLDAPQGMRYIICNCGLYPMPE